MAKNTFRETENNAPEEQASKPQKEKKSAKAGKSSGLKAFFTDPRVQKIMGIFLTGFSLFLFLACLSYLFSGSADQYLILGDHATNGSTTPYANWMGKIGAHIAHFFMYDYFGVGAFFLAFLLFLVGVKVWLKKALLPLFKSFRLSILGMLYFPSAIGFLFHQSVDLPYPHIELTCNDRFVGGFGVLATQWLVFTLGWIGSLFVFIFVTAAFLIFNYNHQVEAFWARLAEWFQRSKEAIKPNEEEVLPDPALEVTPTEEPKEAAQNSFVAPPVVPPVPIQTPVANPLAEPVLIHSEPINEPMIADEESIPPLPELEEDPIVEEEEAFDLDTIELKPNAEASGDGSFDLSIAPSIAAPATQALNLGDLSDLGMEVEGPKKEEELSDDEVDSKLQEFGEYDPKLDLSRYEPPSIDLLKPHGGSGPQITKEELEENKNKIVETLNQYKIEISKIKASIGPTVTLYEIVPAPGVRISKIKNLEDDIALSLAALGIRIIAPIPGKGTIGIEVPNSKPDVVSMRSLIASEKFQNADMELPVVLGKTISNEVFVTDLAKMPHLLMAGATGQGKSVGLNAILVSLLYKKHPSQIKFVLVDPKKVELTLFNKIERHFLAKLPDEEEAIITDTSKVVKTLNSLCIEMDERYELLKTAACRNIKEYNAKFVQRRLNPEKGHRFLPYIVLVVDEFADLIMTAGREVETPIARLAQLARAIGIHLIIATQRPSVNIITGIIKANFPARIAFRVTSKIDSRTILDAGGADQLIGRGDLLYSTGNDLIRIQCGFVDTPEVEEITDFIGNQQGYPSALLLPEVADEGGAELGNFDAADRDELFEEAARIVVLSQQGSASLLQRKLKLGYNRAGRLVDQLEAAGVIGPFEGSKARKVLIPDEISLEQFLKNASSKDPF